MILPDTSVWVEHLKRPEPGLQAYLTAKRVMMHPFVMGELALGGLANNRMVFEALGELREAPLAEPSEALRLIRTWSLSGSGIGYVDLHLLASARLYPELRVWTRDRRLAAAADLIGVGFSTTGTA